MPVDTTHMSMHLTKVRQNAGYFKFVFFFLRQKRDREREHMTRSGKQGHNYG